MIDVIKTIDELNKVIDKLDNVKSSTDINVLVHLVLKTQLTI